VGEYGKTQPWGRPGAVQTPQPAVVANKPRAYEKGFFDFRDGDRVVLLGSAFIERLQAHGYLETMITAALPDKNITFRNLGWSGDTVWGDARGVFGGRSEGFKRLVNDVNLCQPTVIIVCYGENEAYDGEAGLEAFRGGLNKLLDNLEATGARLLLLSPRRHESLGYPLPDATEYNENLKLYRDVIKETAAQREHPFIDLFDTGRNAGHLTTNGIHLSPRGERIVAAELLPLLGVPGGEVRIEIDLAKNSLHANHVQVFDLETSADRVAFQAVWRGATFDACEGEDGSAVWPTLSIKGLPKGRNCQLIIDGKRQNATTSEALAKGVSLPVGVEQTQSLQKLIADKNTLFFNRYRPQNETYLFLFRKHEQGNNAVEIPQFDPLVAEKEKEIAELKKPVAHKFELKLAD
jgi:lysophospholipase L1-like esterase